MNSLIIPVYKNSATIPQLVARLHELSREEKNSLEVVFVVDGSPDDSYRVLQREVETSGLFGQLICLSRNFGSFAAIREGMAAANGEHFAVMAADLQEPVELVQQFFRALETGDVDLVCGQRVSRNDPVRSKLAANLFWKIYRRCIFPEMPPGGVDVFACNRSFRDSLLRLDEANSSLIGQMFWLGFRRRYIPYERAARPDGSRGAWTLGKKLRYMTNSIFAFTSAPITVMTLLGALGVGVSMSVAAIVIVAWLLGEISVSGYTPLMLMQAFGMSLNLLCVGLLGSYLWRTFDNTKRRPLAVVASTEKFPKVHN